MSSLTNLMDKVFSDSTPAEFKNGVSNAISEAASNGTSELVMGDAHYSFAESNGNVVIEDHANNEVTVATFSESGDIELENANYSETVPDVQTEGNQDNKKNILPENSTHDDVNVTIEETAGITDGGAKAGNKHYSLCINGFDSPEEAQEAYNLLFSEDEIEEGQLNFSDTELNDIAFSATELNANYERMLGTEDLQLAYSVLEDAELLKAYSVLADANGVNCDDLYEASEFYSDEATEMIQSIFSEMDINDYFSEMDEDEINAYFSGLDDVEAEVLFSCLEDEESTYTFSEVDELINEVYSDLELESGVNEVFSATDEDSMDMILDQLSYSELDVLQQVLEENPNATFSDVNDALDAINVPLNEVFSDMSEDELNEYFSGLYDYEQDVLYSMLSDEEENYLYSDFLDCVSEYRDFSDEDLKTMAENCNELDQACEECKKSKDPELAKQVKELSEETLGHAEAAEDAGHNVEAVKENCSKYSEEASKVLDESEDKDADFKKLDENGDGKVSIDEWKKAGKSEEDFNKLDSNKDGMISLDDFKGIAAKPAEKAEEPKKEDKTATEATDETKTHSAIDLDYFGGSTRVFGKVAESNGSSSYENPFLSTPIN